MSKEIYVPVDGIAHKVTKVYAPVNGVARSMKKVYRGVNGIARQVFDSFPSIGTPLNSMTWEQIRIISDLGLASQYFNVGDTKEITLNGKVGNVTFKNFTLAAFIIGIDHNSAIEGRNRIHFQIGKTAPSSGVDICLVDSGYGATFTSGSWFIMNRGNTNMGGWEGSDMRGIICPALQAALPSELKSVLKTVVKYTDNTGGDNAYASYVTATTETIFLLSEFELMGAIRYANETEAEYQAQYQYYLSGASKVKYKHDDQTESAMWWLRSPHVGASFCYENESGGTGTGSAMYSEGFAPAFCI